MIYLIDILQGKFYKVVPSKGEKLITKKVKKIGKENNKSSMIII